MPHPKISPILNNCSFYALTPEIKAEVLKYADNDLYDNGHKEEYSKLAAHFSNYYGLPPLSWKDFAAILKNYNAHDTQIILGPVLRSYSKEKMLNGDQEHLFLMAAGNDIWDTAAYVQYATEINQDNGRYGSLAPDHLANYAAGPLGISLTYHKAGAPAQTIDAPQELANIAIYHHGNIHGAQAGGHWEREADPKVAVNSQSSADAQLVPLLELFCDNVTESTLGLELLKQHVQLIHRHYTENYDISSSIQQLMQTSHEVQQYMLYRRYISKELAVRLLGEIAEDTAQFINDKEISAEIEPNIEAYFEGNNPSLSRAELHAIELLKQGINKPSFYVPAVQTKEEVALLVDDEQGAELEGGELPSPGVISNSDEEDALVVEESPAYLDEIAVLIEEQPVLEELSPVIEQLEPQAPKYKLNVAPSENVLADEVLIFTEEAYGEAQEEDNDAAIIPIALQNEDALERNHPQVDELNHVEPPVVLAPQIETSNPERAEQEAHKENKEAVAAVNANAAESQPVHLAIENNEPQKKPKKKKLRLSTPPLMRSALS